MNLEHCHLKKYVSKFSKCIGSLQFIFINFLSDFFKSFLGGFQRIVQRWMALLPSLLQFVSKYFQYFLAKNPNFTRLFQIALLPCHCQIMHEVSAIMPQQKRLRMGGICYKGLMPSLVLVTIVHFFVCLLFLVKPVLSWVTSVKMKGFMKGFELPSLLQ